MTKDFSEPVALGDDYDSVEMLIKTIEERRRNNQQLFGHAIVYQKGRNGVMQRIGARVNENGEITLGAHCEWI